MLALTLTGCSTAGASTAQTVQEPQGPLSITLDSAGGTGHGYQVTLTIVNNGAAAFVLGNDVTVLDMRPKGLGFASTDKATVTIRPGASVTVTLGFPVPSGMTVQVVQFAASSGAGGVAQWRV
jgi:hypothetical protein